MSESEGVFQPEESREAESKKPYEAIVVMPYTSAAHRGGRKSKIDPEFGLTYESKMSTLAAAEAYHQGKAGQVILLGEITVGKPELTTDQFMKELLLAKGVPESAIVTHSGLNNTFSQIEKLAEEQDDNSKFLVISLDFHKPRVEKISKRLKVSADHQKAEDLLIERSEKYRKPVEKWEQSEDMQKQLKTERLLLRPLTAIDMKGILQNILTKRLGPRPPLTKFPEQRKK